jgi:serine/threonine protein kinase/tetratricopeptide (TPR) repeat protein
MSNSMSDLADNSVRDLLDRWDLAEEPGPSGASLGHSLGGAGGSAPRRSRWDQRGSDAALRHVFARSLGGEDGPLDTLGPSCDAPPGGTSRAGSSRRSAVVDPRPGDQIAGFRLRTELGRGAFARVYLAEQSDLGHRLVALKVSRAEGDEPQMLARLQHTHIMPIHSVHDDPATGLRLMCMPYVGGANLAQVLEATGTPVPSLSEGLSLVDALDAVSRRLSSVPERVDGSGGSYKPRPIGPSPLALSGPREAGGPIARLRSLRHWLSLARPHGPEAESNAEATGSDVNQPARQFLRTADPIRAAVWVVARLAEGLDHAHCRGLLHRDLKPSNVLIAADGTPMLLDFNLSTESQTSDGEEGARALLGGTLPYMAPEHLDAFAGAATTSAGAVDERSDLYALGLILFEMIAGRHAFPEPPPNLPLLAVVRFMNERRQQGAPSLRAACPQVPWSLDALVAKCLDPSPQRRYGRARDLAEDLRRFLDDLPMKFAPEPSLRERYAKWTRRNPRFRAAITIALLSAFLLLALGGIMGLLSRSLDVVTARLKLRMFESGFNQSQFLLNVTSGPIEHLREGIHLASRTIDHGAIGPSGAWSDDFWVWGLSAAEQQQVRERTAELILLEARARTVLANRLGTEADRRVALEWALSWLERAERLDPHPAAALFADRARYLAALGQADEAKQARARADRTPLRTSRDLSLFGTSLLAHHDLDRAEEVLQRAVGLDPRAFWAWFALGHCHFEQGRFSESAGDFGACMALEPTFAWPYMNRGLALARAGRLADARDSYDRALALSPQFAEALVNRALAGLELNDLAHAERDLTQAIALGRNDPAVLAALGEVLARLGRRGDAERIYGDLLRDEPDNTLVLVARGVFRLAQDAAGARSDFARVLALDPHNARGHYGMALLQRRDDPGAALVHLEQALDAEPGLLDALQLRALTRARLGDLRAADDVERLTQAPTAHRWYNAACALSVLSRTAREPRFALRALELLRRALGAGFPPGEAAADPDLEPLRDRPAFHELIAKPGSAPP